MSKIYQQIKSATPEVMDSWVDMYYKVVDSKTFILFVLLVYEILYVLVMRLPVWCAYFYSPEAAAK